MLGVELYVVPALYQIRPCFDGSGVYLASDKPLKHSLDVLPPKHDGGLTTPTDRRNLGS